jgi:Na+/phosphate symporter
MKFVLAHIIPNLASAIVGWLFIPRLIRLSGKLFRRASDWADKQ